MMLEEIVELVFKGLNAIFKKRPYIAFFIFLGLFIIALGIWALVGEPQDRVYAYIALGFVMIILAWYTRLVVKRWNIINQPTPSQPEEPPVQEPELTSFTPAAVEAPLIPPVVTPATIASPAAGKKPSVQALHVILGAVAAVVISGPLVLIASLLIGFTPLIAEEEFEGYSLGVGLLLCILIPIAAGLGALVGAVFTRRARVRTPARLNWTALLVGACTGFTVGLLAMIAFYLMISAPA